MSLVEGCLGREFGGSKNKSDSSEDGHTKLYFTLRPISYFKHSGTFERADSFYDC